jgi:hypothetical protein
MPSEGDLLSRLEGAKARRKPWADVARLLERGLQRERAEGIDRAKGPFLRAAAVATGYSTNALNRFVSVLTFATEVGGAMGVEVEQLLRVPFASLELMKRIAAADPKIGRRLLREFPRRPVPISRLRELLRTASDHGELISPRGNAARLRSAHEHAVLGLLESGLPDLTGAKDAKLTAPVAKLPLPISGVFASDEDGGINFVDTFDIKRFAFPDAVAVRVTDGGIDFVDAFDIKHYKHGASSQVIRDIVASAALSARFFRRFWLLVSSSSEFLTALVNAIEALKLDSIGVAEVSLSEASIRPLRWPCSDPVPDHRAQYTRALLGRISKR